MSKITTTITICPALKQRAKVFCTANGKTFSGLVEELLSSLMEAVKKKPRR